jgi:hypothetical protein
VYKKLGSVFLHLYADFRGLGSCFLCLTLLRSFTLLPAHSLHPADVLSRNLTNNPPDFSVPLQQKNVPQIVTARIILNLLMLIYQGQLRMLDFFSSGQSLVLPLS